MMNLEISRQLVHISGVIFILLAQFVGQLIIVYFFLAAAFFLIYSEYIRLEQRRMNKLIDYMDSKLRGIATGLERPHVKRHFMGAFWFYTGCGFTFLIFPFQIATIACLLLAVSDAFSTLVGHRYGKTKFVGNKSFEGSLAFLISGLIVLPFLINFWIAFAAVLVGLAAELIPDIKPLEKLKRSHIIDDNYLIPLLSAAAIYIIFMF